MPVGTYSLPRSVFDTQDALGLKMQIILPNLYHLKSFIYSLTVSKTCMVYLDPIPNPKYSLPLLLEPIPKNMPLPSTLVSSFFFSIITHYRFKSFKSNTFIDSLKISFTHFYNTISSDLPVITYIPSACPMPPSYLHHDFMSCFFCCYYSLVQSVLLICTWMGGGSTGTQAPCQWACTQN